MKTIKEEIDKIFSDFSKALDSVQADAVKCKLSDTAVGQTLTTLSTFHLIKAVGVIAQAIENGSKLIAKAITDNKG